MEKEFELIAKTFMGLEPVLAKELTQLGANDIQIGRRMVSFTGNKELMYRANFQLHTAIRILKPITHFKAKSADDVYEEIKKVDWTEYLDNNKTFAVDAVVFSDEFRHSKFVAYKGDPAAVNVGEIISCYPVIKALTNYRIAHELHLMDVPLIPRIITEMAHSETGIDIHPAATIGHHFTIDHGTGVVVGATCIIGNNVKLYQGVTLGAKSFPLDEAGNPIKGFPRHPILEDNVIVYSNATILGRITIGEGCVVGANMWVTEDMKAGTRRIKKLKD